MNGRISLKASVDLSSSDNLIAAFTGNAEVGLSAAAVSDVGCGVITCGSEIGRTSTITFAGIELVKLGGTLAAEDRFTSNGSGEAVLAVSGDRIYGRMMEAGVSGDLAKAWLEMPYTI